MATYRVCTVGDDYYAGVTAIVCPSDDAALERAEQLADGRAGASLGRRAARCEGRPLRALTLPLYADLGALALGVLPKLLNHDFGKHPLLDRLLVSIEDHGRPPTDMRTRR
jgi:hypothetical protein